MILRGKNVSETFLILGRIQRDVTIILQRQSKVKPSHYRHGGPEGSRKLRFPDFATAAQDGGKVVSLTHQPPLPKGNNPGTHLC